MRFLLLATLILALPTRSAHACHIDFFTAYDLHDRATTVALIKVDKLAGRTATVSVIETFKGVASSTMSLAVDLKSTCSSGMKVGQTGVVFLDQDGDMQGAYEGFERDARVIDTLRAYSSTSVDMRAKALHVLAVSTAWSRSYRAAHALANRPELISALDSEAKDELIARLAKLVHREPHPLMLLAARLHDARVKKVFAKRPRGEDDEKWLGSVVAGAFDGETDPAKLATTIATSKKPAERVGAMERCEQLRGRALAVFTRYSNANVESDWKALAEACRTNKPI